MTTQWYGWQTPTENLDPWQATVDALYNAIDTSVHSVEIGLGARVTSAEAANAKTTLVLSVFPNAVLSVQGSTTAGNWVVLSAAPFGRFNGAFTVTTSGSNMLFNLSMQVLLAGATPALAAQSNNVYYRGVVQPGSISIPSGAINFTNESGWRHAEPLVQAATRFTSLAVVSLGTGAFTCEMQLRYVPISGSSVWNMSTQYWMLLTATQVGR